MSGIRITAGFLKGRKIDLPPGPIRPTSSRAREAVFNILSDEVVEARFLDLFAGSGIMSLEAISRGASSAVAVDISGKSVAALNATAKALDIPLMARRADVVRFLSGSDLDRFDVIYADPPYDYEDYGKLLEALDSSPAIPAGATIAVEHRKKRTITSGLNLARLVHQSGRSWGQVTVEFFDVIDQ